ncbi:solute carrier family 23 member 3 isoform X4 [Echinops telfairi]|uniref:Solute carrier family 23 member 3 isoform X4 n=1 Tax=Echinops telfairi TaxID=9371 RepID=A0AC55DMQ1_ECHTE|nr:solute carrier family 23 member 3 isoform X4 [Echinops telfairi]
MYSGSGQPRQERGQDSMSRSLPHLSQLCPVGSQDALALRSSPPGLKSPSSPSGASLGGSLPWGLSCLLAVQHILVLACLLCVTHLLLLHSLLPGGLSYSPAQLLASSLFSSGVSTALQTWMGSRLPLVQAPSFEFLIPALVLTSQKLPMAIRTPGNSSLVVPRLCGGPGCHSPDLRNASLREVSGAVVVAGLLQGTLGLLGGPGRLFPHCGPLVLAPGLVVAGLSAHREVALFCSAHWGLASLLILLMVVCSQHLGSCRLPLCPWRPAAASLTRALSPAFRLLSVLIPVVCVWVLSAPLGLSTGSLELSAPPEAPWFWLPHPGGVLGVTQAVVLSTGFSCFHLADIDSGRNVFIVGFSIFMALLLPRWLREAPVLLITGWRPLDVFLRSLLTEPILLAGLLGFLLENTIPGTPLERGLGQGQEVRMLQTPRKKAVQEYGLPLPIQSLCACLPQSLRCLCPLPEDVGDKEGELSDPGETADLLPGFGEPEFGPTRDGLKSQ